MSLQDEQKQALGEAAARHVRPGMVLGLGTGSTVARFIDALPALGISPADLKLVPTSRASAAQARASGLNVVDPAPDLIPDLTVDGADEVDRRFSMIKGGGGALLWEKIVAQASRRCIYMVDETKLVATLGAFPLSVEAVSFGADYTEAALRDLCPDISLRTDADGVPYETDSGNRIYDCAFGSIPDPAATDAALTAIPGVVGSGLFVGLVDTLLAIRDGAVVEIGDPSEVFW